MNVRRTVHFSGRVQGVGFRATTCRIAAGFSVTGFVKNLADGGVEMVAEGQADEIARFCEALRTRMKSFIFDCREVEGPATGQYTDFRTAY
jgi:acylphosphatase